MPALRLIFGDQLSHDIAALRDINADGDVVLMVEVAEEATYVKHHKQKLVFVFSAMRHFAAELRGKGLRVDYVTLDDPANERSFSAEVARAAARHQPDRLILTEPSEWRVLQLARTWRRDLDISVEIHPDDRFFATPGDFADFAKGRRELRMEWFYRQMRRRTGLLMDEGKPAGGAWNFDKENRKSLPRNLDLPRRRRFSPYALTREVMHLVEARFPDHFGTLDGFDWPVTRRQALLALTHFVDDCLSSFGAYQDAMASGEPFLFHSLLSVSLNAGLLTPREVCARAEAAYRDGRAPIAAVEGFIRQILGWREYVRGLYWLKMPDYPSTNHLNARRALPKFYWTGDTDMACLANAIRETEANAYAHHIQRLMITGNFALLAGISPAEVEEWYLIVYADAYEWVELPNTHGMALFADGGSMASKPYAASGAYINRMSDYCRDCRYAVAKKVGDDACPFNALYWDFIARNEAQLASNPRMSMIYKTLKKMDKKDIASIRRRAATVLERIE